MKIKNLVFPLLSCLCLQATAQENIVDRLNKTLGVLLPAEYEAIVREFVNTNKTLKKQLAADFTEQYIIKEMKNHLGYRQAEQATLRLVRHRLQLQTRLLQR